MCLHCLFQPSPLHHLAFMHHLDLVLVLLNFLFLSFLVPWMGIEPTIFQFLGQRSIHWAIPTRAALLNIVTQLINFLDCYLFYVISSLTDISQYHSELQSFAHTSFCLSSPSEPEGGFPALITALEYGTVTVS